MVRQAVPEVAGPLPPHDIEAEQAVLGSCLRDRDAYPLLADKLQPGDWYRERHRVIWGAMSALAGRQEPIDILMLHAELERAGKAVEVGGAAYLAELSEVTPTALYGEHYAKVVARCAVNRRLVSIGGAIANLGMDNPPDTDATLGQVEQMVLDLRRHRPTAKLLTPHQRAHAAMDRVVALADGVQQGIPYGWRDLDRETGGCQAGQFVLVAGRPSMGKSLMLSNAGESMARRRLRVLFCSAEMPDSQLMDRTLAGLSGVSLERITQGRISDEDQTKLVGAVGQVAEWPLYLLDDADMTTASIRAAAVEMRLRHGGLDVILVDYVQLLKDTVHGGNDNSRVSFISGQLKAIARGFNVPLIAASQLNRECESRDDKRPLLSDLRDSGALDQDADVVLMLYRDSEYYTEPQWKERERKRNRGPGEPTLPYPKNITEIILRKQRQGRRHIAVRLVFVPQLARFTDHAAGEEPF